MYIPQSYLLSIQKPSTRCVEGASQNLAYFGVKSNLANSALKGDDESADGCGDADVSLFLRDSRNAPPAAVTLKRGDAVVANLPFGRNYMTEGGGKDVKSIISRARHDCPTAPFCTVSGDDVTSVLEECGYTVVRKAGSWNGKRYTFYLTVAVPSQLGCSLGLPVTD